MRIALLLTGHLRSFRNTHPSFEALRNVLTQYGEVDVFAHTWDIEESVTASWWKDHAGDAPPPPNVNEEEIRGLYQPVALRIEPSRQFDELPISIKSIIPVSGLLSMLYSQFQAWKLMEAYEKEKALKYDVLVKMRYDLGFEIAPAFGTLLQRSLKEQALFVPNSNPYELTGACADIFAIGAAAPMTSYLRFFEHFESTLRLYEDLGFRELVPERCLKTYLESHQITHLELEGMRIHILRNNGVLFRICSDQYFPGNEPLCFFRETVVKNEAVVPAGSSLLVETRHQLIHRYTGWLLPESGLMERDAFVRFFSGEWIGVAPVKKLAQADTRESVFHPSVMKSFFEEALSAARYGWWKRFQLALALSQTSVQGSFYLRVFVKTLTKH
ncbi:MAG: hypothetical protein SFU20_09880 [Chitinophagaceae bacterium]|nr:hypothetical protein [Chitinophagaceae bacterium]